VSLEEFDRLRSTADAQVRPDVPAQDFNIVRATNLPDEIPDLDRDVAAEDRLATLRAEHEVVVQ
jgi:hypothetical protein